MGATMDAMACGGFDGAAGGVEIVMTMDSQEGVVVATFDPIFDCDEMGLCEGGEVVEFFVVYAVGSGADDEANDLGILQCFGVALSEHGEGGIGVAIGLEIGEIFSAFAVAPGVEVDAFLDLLGDAFVEGARGADGEGEGAVGGATIGGGEGVVVAEGATADTQTAISVGATESCIDGEFLYALTEEVFEVVGIGVITGRHDVDQVSGFWFQVSSFRFQVSGFAPLRSQTFGSGFGFRVKLNRRGGRGDGDTGWEVFRERRTPGDGGDNCIRCLRHTGRPGMLPRGPWRLPCTGRVEGRSN